MLSPLKRPMASIATANHLQISPVFTPNLFVLADASHLSASPLPHWSPGTSQEASPGLCCCASAKQQPIPLQLTPPLQACAGLCLQLSTCMPLARPPSLASTATHTSRGWLCSHERTHSCVKELKSPIKRHRLAEWVQKKKRSPNYRLPITNSLQPQGHREAQGEGIEKDTPSKWKPK